MTSTQGQTLRYVIIVILGFGVDLLVALALVRLAGVPLVPAAAIGFATGLVLNYLLFELWAFNPDRRVLSWRRFGGTAGIALLALATRLTVVALLTAMVARSAIFAPAIFLAGAAASALVNFLLVNRLFRNHAATLRRSP